mmetsp:Transcript_17628/g.37410  ORF Transcript_17628/g.37410 Transcript_17628/m.37410 type:complete len:312 (+) Transcript_17628:70-1005(+)
MMAGVGFTPMSGGGLAVQFAVGDAAMVTAKRVADSRGRMAKELEKLALVRARPIEVEERAHQDFELKDRQKREHCHHLRGQRRRDMALRGLVREAEHRLAAKRRGASEAHIEQRMADVAAALAERQCLAADRFVAAERKQQRILARRGEERKARAQSAGALRSQLTRDHEARGEEILRHNAQAEAAFHERRAFRHLELKAHEAQLLERAVDANLRVEAQEFVKERKLQELEDDLEVKRARSQVPEAQRAAFVSRMLSLKKEMRTQKDAFEHMNEVAVLTRDCEPLFREVNAFVRRSTSAPGTLQRPRSSVS